MLLKFGYDGTKFYGYQRQKDLPTVEGEILKILKEYHIANNLRSASRTDRGVSAVGNVIRIDTDMSPKDVIGILNSNLKWIYFHSYALSDLNPRFATWRWYRYHLYDFGYDIEKMKLAARIFEGEHDFEKFTRAKKNTILKIDKIEVKKSEDLIIIDFFARNYLWNLIRRIVAAMENFSRGNTFDENVFKKGCNCGLAPPENLILMDVFYENIKFHTPPLKRKTENYFAKMYISSFVYKYLLKLGKL